MTWQPQKNNNASCGTSEIYILTAVLRFGSLGRRKRALFAAMSEYPDSHIYIPDVDIWTFLFERKSKPFSDDQGTNYPDLFINGFAD